MTAADGSLQRRVRPFISLLIRQAFIECLLCAGHSAEHQGCGE